MTQLPDAPSRLPIWLLDLDGVVNVIKSRASSKPPSHIWPSHQWIETEAESSTGATWDITVAKPVVDFITLVHEHGLAEIRWHTTWQESVANVAKAVGLPEFPLQHTPEFTEEAWYFAKSEQGVWWKVPAVYRVVQEGRPVVWTDDDALRDTTREQRRLMAKVPFYLVAPDMLTGLTPKHLRQIRTFLEAKGSINHDH